MYYYLVLGATNAVIDCRGLYDDKDAAIQAMLRFTYGDDAVPEWSGAMPVSFAGPGVVRRSLCLALTVDETKWKEVLYVLVRSVPYLHHTTKARVFYDAKTAKREADSFNAAVSRAQFHAYLFSCRKT